MMNLIYWFVAFQSFFGAPQTNGVVETASVVTTITEEKVTTLSAGDVYADLKESINTLPSEEVFTTAYNGYTAIKKTQDNVKEDLLTIVDFSLPSTEKRMWVIDLTNKELVFHNHVAHGQGSGGNSPDKFSNEPNSHQSSIGFYLTAEPYTGKHGLSMRLDGLEKGYNDKARERAIVVHGADYVSESFIASTGRLGRSHGCPAVPAEMTDDLVKKISGRSVMFLYYPDYFYIKQSALINYASLNTDQVADNNG